MRILVSDNFGYQNYFIMSTTQILQHGTLQHYRNEPVSVITKFNAWTKKKKKSRFLWLALGFVVHRCVIAPIAIIFVGLAGNNLAMFMTVFVAMGATLVVNLAAMPTKITIPVFFFSILVDVGIIASCFMMGFNPSLAF